MMSEENKENILAIMCLILLPFLALLWGYINYSIVKFISWLQYKWDSYQINRINKRIKRMHKKE